MNKQTNTIAFNDALIEAVHCFVSGEVEISEFAVRGDLCLAMTGDEMHLRAALAIIIGDWVALLAASLDEGRDVIDTDDVNVGNVQQWIAELLKFEVRQHKELTTYYWPSVAF